MFDLHVTSFVRTSDHWVKKENTVTLTVVSVGNQMNTVQVKQCGPISTLTMCIVFVSAYAHLTVYIDSNEVKSHAATNSK